MNDDFTAKFIWACAFLFVYSLAGEIFFFKIVKMNLTNSRRKKSPKLLVQSKHNQISTFALSPNTFKSDQIEDGCCEQCSRISRCSFNFTTIAAGNLSMINYNEKLCMTSPEAVVRRCSVKKLVLKLCRIHRKTSVWEVSFK